MLHYKIQICDRNDKFYKQKLLTKKYRAAPNRITFMASANGKNRINKYILGYQKCIFGTQKCIFGYKKCSFGTQKFIFGPKTLFLDPRIWFVRPPKSIFGSKIDFGTRMIILIILVLAYACLTTDDRKNYAPPHQIFSQGTPVPPRIPPGYRKQ